MYEEKSDVNKIDQVRLKMKKKKKKKKCIDFSRERSVACHAN